MRPEQHLEHLASRRSVRQFTSEPVPRRVLERLIEAAVFAPSPSNRQPWRFAVVVEPSLKAKLVSCVRTVVTAMKQTIARSHHAEDFERYGDFFFEPLERAAAVVVPQYRTHDDLIERLLVSGGAEVGDFVTPGAMQGELACTAGAVMNLLNQAHAEGLGACWMAGPTVAREEIAELLEIEPPWSMLGMIALGWPSSAPVHPSRKPKERTVTWYPPIAQSTQ